MPVVRYQGQELSCESGERLRDVIHRAGLSPHNGESAWFNCKGFGTCGTCAVEIEEADALPPKNARERWRLNFPPHQEESGLRLACQIRVTQDLTVHKHEGFWGHVLVERDGEESSG